jgi:hypothetical protein
VPKLPFPSTPAKFNPANSSSGKRDHISSTSGWGIAVAREPTTPKGGALRAQTLRLFHAVRKDTTCCGCIVGHDFCVTAPTGAQQAGGAGLHGEGRRRRKNGSPPGILPIFWPLLYARMCFGAIRKMRRALCARCERPANVCVCAALPALGKIRLNTKVLVLQHPQEASKVRSHCARARVKPCCSCMCLLLLAMRSRASM